MKRMSKRVRVDRLTFLTDAHGDLLDQVRAIVAEHEACAPQVAAAVAPVAQTKAFALFAL